MSDHNPCCHRCDFTDLPDATDGDHDLGCCDPLPFHTDCLRPIVPENQCDDTAATMVFNAETQTFSAVTTLFDSNCSAITDNTGSPFLTPIS